MSTSRSYRQRRPEPALPPVVLCLLAAGLAAASESTPELTGQLEDAGIAEASGLARSGFDETLLWTINDGGSEPRLHAIGLDGADRGALDIAGTENVDWEDLGFFIREGEPWLVIADIGDNESRRDFVSLHVVAEPSGATDHNVASRKLRFRYPGGARDAEAIAVDQYGERVLILSKRTVPAELYAVPLDGESEGILTADKIADLDSLPQPTDEDLRLALPNRDWHWQPTAMDVSADGRVVAIMTYRAVYFYERDPAEPWWQTLARDPAVTGLGDIREAESLSFDATGDFVYLTIEASHAPLYRIAVPRTQ